MGTYADWEANAGEAINQVNVFCRHLLRGNITFSDDTQPPVSEVEIYLANNYSKMVALLAKYGLSAAQTNADIKRILQKYLVACSVVDVENTAPTVGSSKVANPRMASFMKTCDSFEDFLKLGAIQSLSGAVFSAGQTNNAPEWTGTSKSRKDLLAADTDQVQPDITRDMMVNSLASNLRDEE